MYKWTEVEPGLEPMDSGISVPPVALQGLPVITADKVIRERTDSSIQLIFI